MSNTATIATHAGSDRLPPGMASNVYTVGKRELKDAVRSRWFLLYTIAFAALGLAVSFVSAAGAGGTGLSGYGRTTAGLVNLVLLVVPLMALTSGAATIASDRERGMLSYIFAQPVHRSEVLIGKYLGLLGALMACIFVGLGFCTLILAWKGQNTSAESMIWLGGLSLALAAGMLSVGVLISTLVRRASVAVGTAIFVWLSLVFVTDLGLMAGAVALRLPIRDLFALSLINPLQVFKMWTLHAVDANLDVLGPAGLYAAEEYGGRLYLIFGGCLAVWALVPLGIAAAALSRRSPL